MASKDKKPILLFHPPLELQFKRQIKEVATSYLKLTNPTDQRVCFKIKTTSSKSISVKPNRGLIEAYQKVVAAIVIHPSEYNLIENSELEVLVQTVFVFDDYIDVDQEMLWVEVNPKKIMNSKLRCLLEKQPINHVAFLNPSDDSLAKVYSPKMHSCLKAPANTPKNFIEDKKSLIQKSQIGTVFKMHKDEEFDNIARQEKFYKAIIYYMKMFIFSLILCVVIISAWL